MKCNLQIVKNKKIFFIITALVLVAGAVSMLTQGFVWDIDFKGGTHLTVVFEGADARQTNEVISDVEQIARGVVGDKINVAQASDNDIVIKSLELSLEERQQIETAISEKYENASIGAADSVSATVSRDLRDAAVLSVTVAVILMLIYITVRFQFSSALAAVICLCHDVFVVLAAYSILRIPVSSNVIAVALTILGYSINATIVIFDRVRENMRIMKNSSFTDKVNTSINQTLARSLNTTITTLLTIGLIYLLGVQTIKEFSLPLIVGIVAGLYSSVFLAGPLWTIFKSKVK